MSSSPSKLMTCCLKVWGTIVGPGPGVRGWLKKMSGSGPPLASPQAGLSYLMNSLLTTSSSSHLVQDTGESVSKGKR